MTSDITGTGIWSSALRYGDAAEAAEAATDLEELGYSMLWVPDIGGDVFGAVERLLAATKTATVATGILNLWMHTAEETAARHAELTAQHGDRFLVGIGVSHGPFIDRVKEPGTYQRPLAQMSGLPRWARCRRPASHDRQSDARRARSEDARARPDANCRHASVPRDARAHPHGTRGGR